MSDTSQSRFPFLYLILAGILLLSVLVAVSMMRKQQAQTIDVAKPDTVSAAHQKKPAKPVKPYTRDLVALCAPDVNNTAELAAIDRELHGVIEKHDLRGCPHEGIELANIDDAVAQLGKQLFFSKILSGNKDSACVTCHHPTLMGGDGLSLPVGVDAINPDLLGPGRQHDKTRKTVDNRADGSPNVPRNSLTTFNTGLYQQALFWDGRVFRKDGGQVTPDSAALGAIDPAALDSLLATQALFPLVSVEEMRGHDFHRSLTNQPLREVLLQRLIATEDDAFSWPDAFRRAFDLPGNLPANEVISTARLAEALAAYQESQLFIDNAWTAYVNGDTSAISEQAKVGAKLFFGAPSQGFDCVRCHSGKHFTDEQYHISGFPQIGRGKGTRQTDFGRFLVTKEDDHRYQFRTPSLLNTALTGPWRHTGAHADLKSLLQYHDSPINENNMNVMEHYDFSLSQLPQFAGSGYFYSNAEGNTRIANSHLIRQTALDFDTKINRKPNINDQQAEQLIAFLNTLSDRCLLQVDAGHHDCIQSWLDEGNTDPDRLVAVFGEFSTSVDNWQLPAPVSDIPDIPDAIPVVDAVEESCVMVAASEASATRFIEVGEALGLAFEVASPNIRSLIRKPGQPSIQKANAIAFGILQNLDFLGMALSGDFNQDGYPDLILYRGSDVGPAVMINTGDGRFVNKTADYGLGQWKNKVLIGGALLISTVMAIWIWCWVVVIWTSRGVI